MTIILYISLLIIVWASLTDVKGKMMVGVSLLISYHQECKSTFCVFGHIPVVHWVALLFHDAREVLFRHTSAADYTAKPRLTLLQQLTAGRERGVRETAQTATSLAFLSAQPID